MPTEHNAYTNIWLVKPGLKNQPLDELRLVPVGWIPEDIH